MFEEFLRLVEGDLRTVWKNARPTWQRRVRLERGHPSLLAGESPDALALWWITPLVVPMVKRSSSPAALRAGMPAVQSHPPLPPRPATYIVSSLYTFFVSAEGSIPSSSCSVLVNFSKCFFTAAGFPWAARAFRVRRCMSSR